MSHCPCVSQHTWIFFLLIIQLSSFCTDVRGGGQSMAVLRRMVAMEVVPSYKFQIRLKTCAWGLLWLRHVSMIFFLFFFFCLEIQRKIKKRYKKGRHNINKQIVLKRFVQKHSYKFNRIFYVIVFFVLLIKQRISFWKNIIFLKKIRKPKFEKFFISTKLDV